MIFEETNINGVFIVKLTPFVDDRGMFARLYCKREFEAIKPNLEFVQVNYSKTDKAGTIRGLHYQKPPFSEGKLIRCIKGGVLDVVVDIRSGSPTFLDKLEVTLSAENKLAIYIPEGMAHGFQTLEDDTELLYQHTEYYQPSVEGSLNYQDPMLNINWPLPVSVISQKDKESLYLSPDFRGINVD